MSGEPSLTDDVRTLVAASMDGVGVVDDDVFAHANRALATVHGLAAAEEVVGLRWQRLYPATERERLAREVVPRVRAEGHWCGTATGRRDDGTTFAQRLAVSRTHAGRLVWVVREAPAAAVERSLLDDLTDRQQEVLRVAYHAGYFDWPRERTAEEVADSLGIAAPTLHAHIRKAESSLLAALFDGDDERRR